IISTHPRTQNMINEKVIKINSLIKTLKPLVFNDYVKLQLKSKPVLSDSATISEESALLGLKPLNLLDAHEIPEAIKATPAKTVGLNKERSLQGLEILETQTEDQLRLVADYSMTNVSDKVVRSIISYVDYVNRVVWGK